MAVETNHSLSVDCVIFGYDSEGLKVLLMEQRKRADAPSDTRHIKLPGSMILESETLPAAARRVLLESTGLEKVYLKQIDIFSDPQRVCGEELEWIASYHNITTTRVVTVGYYAVVPLSPKRLSHTNAKGAEWVKFNEVPPLIMDHGEILSRATQLMREDFERSPIAFELLPKRFTIRSLQDLFSAVMGIEIDNRNFRKKILSLGILTPTGEKQQGVAHKPAEYYTFNLAEYRRNHHRGIL